MNLQFADTFNGTNIHFLDLTLIGQQNENIIISLYRKSIATNSTLLAMS